MEKVEHLFRVFFFYINFLGIDIFCHIVTMKVITNIINGGKNV